MGGGLVGVWEALTVVLGAGLGPGAIAVVGLLFGGALGGLAAGLVGVLVAASRGERSRIGTLAAGAVVAAGLSLGARWAWPALPLAGSLPGSGGPWPIVGCLVAGIAAARWVAERKGTSVLFALVGALVAVSPTLLGWRAAPASSSGPPVVLITVDAARADRFVDPRVDTTASNRVGSEGLRFARAFAQVPTTHASYAGLLSGSGPWVHGVWSDDRALDPAVPTLAEALREAGWDTAAFVGSARLGRGLGLERGFRVVDDDLAWVIGARHLPVGRLWRLLRPDPHRWPTERRADDVVDRAVHWMSRRPGAFFAWIQLGDARPPLAPPHPFDVRYAPAGGASDGDPLPEHLPMHRITPGASRASAQWAVAQYDGAIASADRQVARVLDALDRRGVLDRAVVVVTSPHGLTLGEDGRWFEHRGATEAELHVPLRVRLPRGMRAGTVVHEPVELADVAPSVLGWVGLEPPAVWDGVAWTGEGAQRSLARSVAVDPSDPSGRWRLAVVHNRRAGWVHVEDPARPDRPVGTADPETDARYALVKALMAERARGLLPPADPPPATLSPSARRWLARQGIDGRTPDQDL